MDKFTETKRKHSKRTEMERGVWMVTCKCGWQSPPCDNKADAVAHYEFVNGVMYCPRELEELRALEA